MMRLWWPWRKYATPGSGTDPCGRLIDGDTVLGPGQQRWVDLLDDAQVSRDTLTEHTALLPVVTPAARLRGQGGGWR